MADWATGALDGQCLCGQCKLSCDEPPLKALHCQCTSCQKLSGTGHLTNVIVKKGSAIVTGPLTVYELKADSGNINKRMFCAVCGSQMLRENSGMPDISIIHAGTFEHPDAISPQAVVWHKSAVAWDHCDPSLPVFDEMPPKA